MYIVEKDVTYYHKYQRLLQKHENGKKENVRVCAVGTIIKNKQFLNLIILCLVYYLNIL